MTQLADNAGPLDLEVHRGELTGYCYRMLGSTFDADDAVQETMVRAWQAADRFEGRSSLRSWLYRIATNVCLDLLRSRRRRALPMDLSSPVPSIDAAGRDPARDHLARADGRPSLPLGSDPAEQAVVRDTVRLAFVAALQQLPPRQRAVLILREVLCWPAADVADLLGTTVASVNSALQRARATLSAADTEAAAGPPSSWTRPSATCWPSTCEAFERYDIDRLVGLLHEDASISMPPFAMWLRGRDDLQGWYLGHGHRLQGFTPAPRRPERFAGLRPVQARHRGGPRAVGATGPRDPGRADRARPPLPRHPPVRTFRPARPARTRRAARSPRGR